MPYPWVTSIAIAVIYYGYIFALFTNLGKIFGREALVSYPDLADKTPFALVGVYLWYASQAGGIQLLPALKVAVWLIVPCVLLRPAKNAGNKFTVWDALAIAALWLPFDLHWVSKRSNAIKDALDWPILAISAVILALTYWVCQRQLNGTKTRFSLRRWDFPILFAGLFFLMIALLPAGLWLTDFLVPAKFWETELQSLGFWQIVWNHLATKTFAVYLLKLFVTVGISEEFLFRGIIQNFLDKTWNRTASLIVASLLFGAAHLNNGAGSIYPADWNWTYAAFATVAGLTYGTVFRYSSSILYAVLLHSLVDSIWHTFFR